MPYNLFGEWVPEKVQQEPKKAIKVRLVKRGQSELTVIFNLDFEASKMQELASYLKKRLGCGGSVREGNIEVQGNKVDPVKEALVLRGIKVQN